MLYINAKQVFEDQIAKSMGFKKYQYIMECFKNTNVASDTEYQRIFNGFYLVRRNAQWRKTFYDLFEKIKTGNPSFKTILQHLFETTGNIEASFSSKMLATINADMPIWDQYVIKNLNLKITGKTKTAQLDCAINLYDEMINWYNIFLKSNNGLECIEEFDRMLPNYKWISSVKKADFFLWSIRQ